MKSLTTRYRQLKRELQYLKGYVDLDRNGNQIVRRTDFANCPRPVLLLYGFMSSRRVFEVLERRLRRDSFCVWSINLGGLMDVFNTRGIDASAELVQKKVERLYQRFPQMGPLSIVGHSKGGLIASYYAKRLGGEKRVKTVVTLGTPFNGTPSAYWGILSHGLVSRSIWQLTPVSPFIRRLNMGPFPEGLRVTSIYSRDDKVNPFPSCYLENADDQMGVRNVEVRGVSHREFVTSRSVYQLLRKELFSGYGMATPAEPRPLKVAR